MSERSRLKRAARKRKVETRRRFRNLRGAAVADYLYDDYQTALAKAKRILENHPRDVDALQVLCRSAIKLNDLATLAEYAERLFDLEVETRLALPLNLGMALYHAGRYDAAERALVKFLDCGARTPAWRAKAEGYLRAVELARREARGAAAGRSSAGGSPGGKTAPVSAVTGESGAAAARVPAGEAAPLYHPRVRVTFRGPETPAFLDAPSDHAGVCLRHELEHARLARGFDELLCLKIARGVEQYWYQIETVRRALKRFRGRVLLADEVGLGKTVEAGMIATEYILRGLARRVLVLVPPSLVTQWREELASKFGLEFDDAAEHSGESGYWSGAERVVASVALARMPRHFSKVTARDWDLVVVDEAHRLKNRRTRGWKLVNGLRPKFLVMLSATPVQNDLVELYNIVTLLRPGTFGTEAEFKKRFVRKLPARSGQRRRPDAPAGPDGKRAGPRGEVKDVEALREVLSSVMVRNTRSLIDAKLPRRFAETFIVEPTPEERAGLARAEICARAICREGDRRSRMAARQLILQAGSSPAALASALRRIATRRVAGRRPGESGAEVERAAEALEPLGTGAKGRKLVELLAARPDEKKLVFVQFTRTLASLGERLEAEGLPYAVFTGSMTPAEKERAIERFRDEVPVLVSTGSGGEGRNLQFARTVVNFDLPWNPMAIEQRIGRVHRLGQKRDVFVFNMALRGSIEERLLGILDRKINMFEMVVGEIDDILGDLEGEFASVVFDMWLEAASQEDLDRGFDGLAQKLIEARKRYRGAKELDERLFGEDLAS